MKNSVLLRKPRELGDILSDSFKFLQENIKTIYKPILLIAVLWATIYSFSIYSGAIIVNPKTTGFDAAKLGSFFLSMFYSLFLSVAGSLSIYIILFNLIKFQADRPGEDPQTADLFTNFGSQFLRLFLFSIPMTLLFIILTILFLIPGIWFSVIYAFFFPVLVFEKGSFGFIFKRTRYLIKDHWWNCFLTMVIPYILLIGVLSIISAIVLGGFLVKNASSPMDPSTFSNPTLSNNILIGTSIFYFFYFLLTAFFTLWPSSCIALQYLNLVERKDLLSLSKNLDSLGSGVENSHNGPERTLSGNSSESPNSSIPEEY